MLLLLVQSALDCKCMPEDFDMLPANQINKNDMCFGVGLPSLTTACQGKPLECVTFLLLTCSFQRQRMSLHPVVMVIFNVISKVLIRTVGAQARIVRRQSSSGLTVTWNCLQVRLSLPHCLLFAPCMCLHKRLMVLNGLLLGWHLVDITASITSYEPPPPSSSSCCQTAVLCSAS